MTNRAETAKSVLHIYVLVGFALAQPLYDVLSRGGAFFLAHGSPPQDIVALAVVLSLLLPVVPAFLLFLADCLLSQRGKKAVRGVLIGALVSLVVMTMIGRTSLSSCVACLLIALASGCVAGAFYSRCELLRQFLSVLSPTILIFPLVFLFKPSMQQLVLAGKNDVTASVQIDSSVPVIVVVFDEMPATSLMNTDLEIDTELCTNFASLAQHATWYRTAVAPGTSTTAGLIGITTGCKPTKARPTADNWPNNIFTLLGSSYRMMVFEQATRLCPDSLKTNSRSADGFPARVGLLLKDVAAVYGHMVLPGRLSRWLPDVTTGWKGFWQSTGAASGADATFAAFLASVDSDGEPTLYFLHIVLPHVPWAYYPSGKRYNRAETQYMAGFTKGTWVDTQSVVTEGYKRHLLQVGYVDRLLGQLIRKLKQCDLYDRSLLVVTADHGVSFWPGKSRRSLSPETPLDVLGVPLFVKEPGQRDGRIVDEQVSTLDILPTVADVLSVDLTWETTGTSLRDPAAEALSRSLNLAPALDGRRRTLDHGSTLFRDRSVEGLFRAGPWGELQGVNTADLSLKGATNVVVQINDMFAFRNVDRKAPVVPGHIRGRLPGAGAEHVGITLAIAVNDTIRGVTRTYVDPDQRVCFSVVIPETSFVNGQNEVAVFVVSAAADGRPQLSSTKQRSNLVSTDHGPGRTVLKTRSAAAGDAPVVAGVLTGRLERVEMDSVSVTLTGWAVDLANACYPDRVAVYVDEEYYYHGICCVSRPGLLNVHGLTGLLHTGFSFVFSAKDFPARGPKSVRIFAFSEEGIASELSYPSTHQ